MKPWFWLACTACSALLILVNAQPQSSPNTGERLARLRNLGKAFYENPTTQNEAVEQFRRALQLAPGSARERLNYGLALLRAGKTAEAITELQRVQKEQPSLPHTWFNLGITYKKQGEHEKAVEQFEQMVKLVPDDPISHYNLGALYKLIGRNEESVSQFQLSAKLDPNLAAARFQLYNAYRTSSRPAEARRELEVFQRLKKQQEGAAIPEDVEWNMYAEVYDIMENLVVPPPSDKLQFQPQEAKASLTGTIGDYNNDGLLDSCVVKDGKPAIAAAGQDAKAVSAPAGKYDACLWLDYDHDYDLDLFLLGENPVLLRNEGQAGFADRTADFPFVKGRSLSAAAFRLVADTKGFDLAVSYAGRAAVLYRDKLQGKYEPEDLPVPEGARSLEPADLDNDGWIDLAYSNGAGVHVSWNKEGRLQAPAEIARLAGQFTFADVENRGVLDLVGPGSISRNLGRRKFSAVRPLAAADACRNDIEAFDSDKDGRVDLACGARLALNRTSSGHNWIGVNLEGVKNLKLAHGAEVEVKAGPRYEKKIYDGRPLVFGLGSEKAADTVRITWPNGLIQNEVKQAAGKYYSYKEAQRLSGSCPMIWSWNGREFEYITDVLGVAPLGASAGNGQYFPVDHDEYIQIPGKSLRAVDGEYEIRITEELSEVAYLDQIQLIAVDHPSDSAIYTNDKFKGPPFPEFRLFGVSYPIPPISARDHQGRDVLEKVLEKDRTYPDGFGRNLAGVAGLHHIDFDFGPRAVPSNKAILVLSGWVDWADGSTFLGASQEPGGGLVPPYVQVKDGEGNWKTVVEDMGMPAGKPKTIVVNLSGKFLSASREIRIVTNLCVYWDQVFLSEDTGPPELALQSPELRVAELRFRGFSPVTVHPERKQPESFRYADPKPVSMWNPTPGFYTRYGDVQELAAAVDDRMIIMGSGDELRLRFDARRLAPPPRGWTRDFLLLVDGWAKDRDPNTAYSQSTEPLPFHGMSRYPYPAAEAFPDTPEHRDYRRKYNTRPALRLLQPLWDRPPGLSSTAKPSASGSPPA
jgi:tetratricopeptide (TPR) repeat protein